MPFATDYLFDRRASNGEKEKAGKMTAPAIAAAAANNIPRPASPAPKEAPKKEPRKPWFWRGMWRNRSHLSSVMYSSGIVALYSAAQGYLPSAMKVPLVEDWILPDIAVMGVMIGCALIAAVLYGWIEFSDTQTASLPTPWEHAVESFVSQIPMYAFVFVLTSWGWGNITVSWFQWLVGVILFLPVLLDNLGFTAIIAQRLFLTDETRLTK